MYAIRGWVRGGLGGGIMYARGYIICNMAWGDPITMFTTYYLQRSIIYNISWEDPRVERDLLQLGSDDVIITISSAGCNVLDYLCSAPKVVISDHSPFHTDSYYAPCTISHSPFTPHSSLLTPHSSLPPLTTHHLLLTIHSSFLTPHSHLSLLTTY